MKHYVYKITNIKENKHYIGARSAKNPNKDLGIKYFSSSSDKEFMSEQQEFPERFEYNILEVFSTRKDAINKEIELHDLYDVAINESFYNKSKQTSIGFCTSGKSHTEETREKISLATSGENNPMWGKTGENSPHWNKPKSEEHREKIGLSISGKNNPNFEKPLSQEHREKIGLSISGKNNPNWGKFGNEHPKYGKPISEETKRKISLATSGENHYMWGKTSDDHPMWGRKHSELSKEKNSISNKKAQQKRYIENARRFIIHDAEGNLIHDELIPSFVRFCTDNNYPKGSFGRSHKTNEPVKGGKFKGWTVRRTNQQTKGE